MTHTIERSGDIYTCPVCSFRAVHTSRGAYTLDPGAGRDMHLAAILLAQDDQRRYVARVLARLRAHHDPGAFLQRLERAVLTEYEV